MPVKKKTSRKKSPVKIKKSTTKRSPVFYAEWALRIGIFGTFVGHGIFALQVKAGWIPYFVSVGITEEMAITLLPLIGLLDVVVGFLALIYPLRIVLAWAAFWGLTTAAIRPISGEPIWDLVERSSNFMAPIALLFLRGWPKKLKDLFGL